MRAVDPADVTAALATEWLITNGRGGYAMGTALGANTRRYHGLFVAAMWPPIGRVLVLHSANAQLVQGDDTIELDGQQFGPEPVLHPDGWRHLTTMELEPPLAVRWTHVVDGLTIVRDVEIVRGASRVRVRYHVSGARTEALLRIRPRMPLRDFHAIDHAGDAEPTLACFEAASFVVERGEIAARVSVQGGAYRIEPEWWHDFAYTQDRDRGQPWREDVWSPGIIEARVTPERPTILELDVALERPVTPRVPLTAAPACGTSIRDRLAVAADQFVVGRCDEGRTGCSIIAGYPWFADWGRDALIALPGLLLGRGRIDESIEVLRTFARHAQRGLIPNCFHDNEPPQYNAADAALWFVRAVHRLHEVTGAAPDDLTAACGTIINAYRRGTDFGIGVDPDDGLLVAGDGIAPVTWMDAQRDGCAFTPRVGKVVELNALWHAALLAVGEMVGGVVGGGLRNEAQAVAQSFRDRFWWPERGCLHDVLEPRDGAWIGDERLRPNQIFAGSLGDELLEPAQRAGVLDAVRTHLLTPYGLRTLSPDDPGYVGRYEGDLRQRDAAYHNGTVWPWLLGPYGEAVLRERDFSAEAREAVRGIMSPLLETLDRDCLGQIAEVYDGDAPHRPSGCPAQAWSVAVMLELLDRMERKRAPQ